MTKMAQVLSLMCHIYSLKIPSFMLLNCRAHLFSYLYIIVWTIYNKILERDWFSRSCGRNWMR